jgi:hypothetical protein
VWSLWLAEENLREALRTQELDSQKEHGESWKVMEQNRKPSELTLKVSPWPQAT